MAKFDWTDRKHMVIDLGTNATRIFIEGQGLIFNESSVIAFNSKTKKIISIGNDAKKYTGKLNRSVSLYSLQSNGVINDIKLVVSFLNEVFKKFSDVIKNSYVTLACTQELTSIERQSLMRAIKNLGCFYVNAVDSEKLALYGAGFDITSASGRLVLDMGAGKISCGLVSSNEVVLSHQVKTGGSFIDQEIMKHVKAKKHIAVGEVTAEKIKNLVGTLIKTKSGLSTKIYGYDITSMMPIEVVVKEEDIEDIMKRLIFIITSLITNLLEDATSEVAEDVIRNGIVITGGLAKTSGLKVYLEDFFEIPVIIPKNCETAVVDGGIKYRDFTRQEYISSLAKHQEEPSY